MNTKQYTLSQIFPLISGNLSEYSMNIPENFESEFLWEWTDFSRELPMWSPLYNNCILGEQADIDNIISQALAGNQIQFTTSKWVIRARFTPNVWIDENGRFIDRVNWPITQESFESIGMNVVFFTESIFQNIPSVPFVTIMGLMNESYVRMLYIYSPNDNLVMLFSLQWWVSQESNDEIWISFIESL